MNTTRLDAFVIKKSIRAESIPGYEELEVLGVSNQLGITITGHKKSKDLAKYLLIEEGDFAYNPYRINVGSIGLTPAGKKGLVSPAYVVFRTTNNLIPELLLDFLKSQEGLRQIGKYARGTVRKALRFEDLVQIELPIPSMDKQLEILSKRKSIETEIDLVQSELTHQQTLLKKLRQQILQEAIEGKLTADWRAQNPDVEPASELLKRIAAEKAQLIKDKKIKAQKLLPPITDEEKPFELPQGWEWCRLGDLGIIQGGGTPSKSMKGFWGGDIPWICPKDMKRKYLNSSIFQITPEAVKNSSAKIIDERSVLFVVRGMILSHTLPVSINTENVTINQDMKALTPYTIGSDEFIALSLIGSSKAILKRVRTSTHGTCRLESDVYFNWIIALPTYEEQQEILTKVEKLLALCDQLETQISQNQSHAEQLMHAVLKEAFSHNSEAEPAANKRNNNTQAPEAADA